MTKKQLRELEHLPAVIEALTAIVGQAEKLRLVMAKASGLGVPLGSYRGLLEPALDGMTLSPQPQQALQNQASHTQVMLPTPERAEYEASRRAGQQNYSPEEEETPDKKRQRELLANFRKSPARQAKLAQFDGDKDEVAQ